MLHAIPQVRISVKVLPRLGSESSLLLRFCEQEAALLGNKDKQRLLSSRKLALKWLCPGPDIGGTLQWIHILNWIQTAMSTAMMIWRLTHL